MIYTFGIRGDSQIFLDHQERFFREEFFPRLEAENIRVIFNLGDTFDRRKYINFATLQRCREFFFSEVEKRGIEYHMILGNHDVYFVNSNHINSIKLLLNEYSNFHVYENTPVELEISGVKFMLCPWITKNNQEECVKSISETNASFLMGHFEIKGFEMMKGTVCEHGLEKEFFTKFEGVYSGHFHHPSEYANIRYLGAQYEMNWSDYGGKRGFHIFDTDKRDIEFVENRNRIFHKIVYDDTDFVIEDLNELDVSPLKSAYVKVMIKNRTNPYIFDLFIAKIEESGAADVKTIEDTLNLESTGLEDILDETKDTKEILHEYIDSIDTNIEKNKIKQVIDNLYVEASNIR